MKELVHEIVAHHDNDKVIGEVWWDGRKLQTSTPAVHDMLKDRSIFGKSFNDGKDFLEVLPSGFTNGYTSVRRKKS